MTEFTVFKKSHSIFHREGKEPIIKIEFTVKEDDYQEFISELTVLNNLTLVMN